jgi:hypothetical protein
MAVLENLLPPPLLPHLNEMFATITVLVGIFVLLQVHDTFVYVD